MKKYSALLFLFFLVSCSHQGKVWQAEDFENTKVGKTNGLFFGKVVPVVKRKDLPACRIEIESYKGKSAVETQLYDLPEDGMVYFSAHKGTVWIRALHCYRKPNWLPSVVFENKIPTFRNLGGKTVTYFGTLKADVWDVDDFPATNQSTDGRYHAKYRIEDEQESATEILLGHFSNVEGLKVEKNLLVPVDEQE